MKFSAQTKQSIINLALELNFWRKQIRSSKMAVIEQIIKELDLTVDQTQFCDWLLTQKPVVEKAKAAKVEPIELMAGNLHCKLSGMPVIEGNGFVVVGAQNNTTPHVIFDKLVSFARDTGRQLVVIPNTYSVPSPCGAKIKKAFNDKLKPFMINEDVWLGCEGGVKLCYSADVLPTAKQPVNTARMLNTGEVATIVASPKQQAETMPRFKGEYPSKALTTGFCTNYHYRQGRAGTEAEKDHVFGAWIVDYTQEGFTFANIEADSNTGEFYNPLDNALDRSVVLGDLHSENLNPQFFAHTLDQLAAYPVDTLVLHDVFDCLSRNGHNRNSSKFLYQMGQRAVADDLRTLCGVLLDLDGYANDLYIVRSNHDDMLDRWVDDNSYNPNQDYINAKLYHFLKFAITENIDNGDDELAENALRAILSNEMAQEIFDLDLPNNLMWGALDSAYYIHGIDVSQHGHIGVNGSRGNPKTLSKLCKPLVTGHTHSPAINGSTYTAGVSSTFDMGYNKGGSSWDYANVHIFDNGQRSLIWSIPSNSPLYK